jgi:hypothetical protein
LPGEGVQPFSGLQMCTKQGKKEEMSDSVIGNAANQSERFDRNFYANKQNK